MANTFFGDDIYGEYTSGSISLGDFKRQMDDKSIVIPGFQRNFVWTGPLKQRYLETLSKRGPIFGFVMNYISSDGVYQLIDGQNRGTTMYEFMSNKILFNKDSDDGGSIKYEDIKGSEKRIFDRQEIHFIKTINWSEDDCQDYFRCIQEGMKLTRGEEIHSAQNNFFQNKIVYLSRLFNESLEKKKKEGGFNYPLEKTKNRYVHYEIIGCLLTIFLDNKWYDRPGQVALKQMKLWDDFDSESNEESDIARKTSLENAVNTFERVMKYYITLRDNSDNLNNMTYSRDSTFMRNMFFIFKNNLHNDMETPSEDIIEKFNETMGVILTKNTPLFKYIVQCGTNGGMDQIMEQYMRVFTDPNSVFILPQ